MTYFQQSYDTPPSPFPVTKTNVEQSLMADLSPTPDRRRPDLNLSFTPMSSPLTRSPHPLVNSPGHTPFAQTPLANSQYSPFRSASLRGPPSSRPETPFRLRRTRSNLYGSSPLWWKLKQLLKSRTCLFIIVFSALIVWWLRQDNRDWESVRTKSMELGKSLWHDGATNGMRFFPASNPKIHYMGRWTATKNRMRKDGAFPGAYLDIRVNGTARVYLELGNEGQGRRKVREKYRKAEEQMEAWAHLEFQERPGEKPAKPISILSRVDEEEYVLLPNASHLISLTGSGLSSNTHHDIRVIVPMIGGDETNVAQVAGVWLDKAGSLLRIEGSPLDEEIDDEDIQKAESDTIGKKHREGLSDLSKWRNDDEEEEVPVERRKVVEIITDTPNRPKPDHHGRYGGGHGLLAGVMGWEFLLGEMFGIDHVSTGVDGMCLTQDCIGGTAEPVSMADVFFRSGPVNSSQFRHPWMFNSYIPDVLILDLGASDHRSFERHMTEYNMSLWDLHGKFEDSYVSFVKAIRQLAYPKHPSVAYADRGGFYQYAERIAPASIPIFIMRPLRGEMEHATQNAANRLRADGDRFVFWLDTSGWLDETDMSSDDRDFYLDETGSHSDESGSAEAREAGKRYRLMEQGNQRVAIFLHMHVCSYLAKTGEQCAFLPAEVYQGRAFEPDKQSFDRYVEGEKKRKLRKLFIDPA